MQFICLVAIATTSLACSLTAPLDRTDCESDAQCSAAFGATSTCQDDGYCSEGGTAPEDEIRIGFVLPSGENDGGWSQTHLESAEVAAKELGADLFFRASVPSPDVRGAIDDLLENDGANVIFTPSSGYIAATTQAAIDNPDTYFVSCCGDANAPNLTSYFGRIYQPLYVLGYVAGKESCTGRLGVVASLGISQFVRHIDAFALGAQRAAVEDNRSVQVDVRFVGAFFDPAGETAAAEDLIANGSDVILAQVNTTAALEAMDGAKVSCATGTDGETEVLRVGYHSPNACAANADDCIASAYWNWAGLYESKIRAFFDGTIDTSDVGWSPLTNDSTSVVDYTALNVSLVGAQVRAAADDIRNQAVADPQFPFRGPLNDNQGAQQVANGQDLSDSDLDSICWFAPNVIDTSIDGTPQAATVPDLCSPI